jgi:hypothetical protein
MRHLRLVGLLVLAVVLGAVAVPATAHAQEAPTLTVTPNTGLDDGEVVSLRGTGFGDVFAIGALQCPSEFAGRTEFTINEVLGSCDFLATTSAITVDAAGNLTGSALVQEVFTPSSGGASYDCTVRNDCVLLVAGLGGASDLLGATAAISFGPNVPQTKADCKRGGWRNLANDQGQSFRNQGECVSYVVAHRR